MKIGLTSVSTVAEGPCHAAQFKVSRLGYERIVGMLACSFEAAGPCREYMLVGVLDLLTMP